LHSVPNGKNEDDSAIKDCLEAGEPAMIIWIFTGGRKSNGARELSKCENFKRMRTGLGVKKDDVIVGWGVSNGMKYPENLPGNEVLNLPLAVEWACDKLKTFKRLSAAGVETCKWTEHKDIAKQWLDDGHTIVARTELTGHEGSGIIIIEEGKELVEAPLYTRYIFKEKEFRVHATRNKAFATHRKVKDPKRDVVSWKVRSWKNGFIFQRNNIEPNQTRDELTVKAVAALGLDFGAVDIVEDKYGNFFVLEVNTAPGIEGQTVPLYAEAIRELAENVKKVA
jgi:hypothetical protein